MQHIDTIPSDLLESDNEFVIATVIDRSGSTPRLPGARMIIKKNGNIIGTIGGGRVESDVIQACLNIFLDKKSIRIPFDLSSGDKEGMDLICGGKVEILLEYIGPNPENKFVFLRLKENIDNRQPCLSVILLENIDNLRLDTKRCLLYPDLSRDGAKLPSDFPGKSLWENTRSNPRPFLFSNKEKHYWIEPVFPLKTVYIFGAGHVSQQLETLCRMVDFHTVVIDDREDFANRNRFPLANEIVIPPDFGNAFNAIHIDDNSYIVIVTRGHSHDGNVLKQALKTSAAYIGMIGSTRKKTEIFTTLMKQGFQQQDLDRVYSPIGLSIGAQTPQEIAVSIVAELIQVRSDKC